ncbi:MULTISPECIES: glycosyltransferase family 4 protein [Cytobacillus]|uniref:glycosyltransferase family 4 protein n=1 Tax=Cytobacillus TaxID=2675230 RepID=UPI00203ADEB1|nr:glycosyltransferase [Cytobacillus oceanisediminis]MBY0159619.1 glycosyltransferase [Cytobacillus firmus]MCM3527624.1 glycosyltransferase [Cytobacillus oceanisediminis]USK46570.1 glycosyltransferase [Cytobacillus oceanisediminis]
MNILFVFYIPSGGVETLNRQRCAALKKYNIHSHCLYYETKKDMVNHFDGPCFIGKDRKMIKEVLDNGNYSAVVIVSDFRMLSLIRSLDFKGKLIFEIQGLGAKDQARAFILNGYSEIHRHSDALLNPNTPHIVQLLDELFPDKAKFNFNNCFDSNNFCYQVLPKPPQPIVAWIGRIEDNKNWKEFLHIGHQILHQINPNIQLYMFEDPTLAVRSERIEFEKLIVSLGLTKNLSVMQNIPNVKMAEFFSKIGDSGGFLCSTSKVEGAPYSVLEALSCKCPILTTDSDGVRSSIIHNKTGKYYTLGNIQEAVNEAKELMTNLKLRNYIRSNGVVHVRSNFSPEEYGQNFINMLRALDISI